MIHESPRWPCTSVGIDPDAYPPSDAVAPRCKEPRVWDFSLVIARLLEEAAYLLDRQDTVFEIVVEYDRQLFFVNS